MSRRTSDTRVENFKARFHPQAFQNLRPSQSEESLWSSNSYSQQEYAPLSMNVRWREKL